MADPDLDALLDAWDIGQPRTLTAPPGGISRLSRFVDAPTGRYVVSVYPAHIPPAQVAYEHAVLGALGRAGLPFAVPTPQPTRDGRTLVETADGRAAALYDVIPGQAPDHRRPAHAHAVGEALAHLHRALARLDVAPPPGRVGAFALIDRLLAEPDDLLHSADLPGVAPADQVRVLASLAEIAATVPALLAGEPHQICHGDYNTSNALLVGDRVSGLLDFEVVGPDARALDLGMGWYYVCSRSPDDPFTPISAFAEGYRSVEALSERGAAAAARYPRLYVGAALLLTAARVRSKIVPAERMGMRVEQLRLLDGFLAEHEPRLVEALAGR